MNVNRRDLLKSFVALCAIPARLLHCGVKTEDTSKLSEAVGYLGNGMFLVDAGHLVNGFVHDTEEIRAILTVNGWLKQNKTSMVGIHRTARKFGTDYWVVEFCGGTNG